MSPVTQAKTRSRMSAADRREAILDAARNAFADTGYHETSLDAVAERAGVSKALLYEHFASKRELYVAMLEMHVHELVERISGAVAGAEPGEPRMRAGLEAFFGFVEERRGAWRIRRPHCGFDRSDRGTNRHPAGRTDYVGCAWNRRYRPEG